jgi:hypothetical protein
MGHKSLQQVKLGRGRGYPPVSLFPCLNCCITLSCLLSVIYRLCMSVQVTCPSFLIKIIIIKFSLDVTANPLFHVYVKCQAYRSARVWRNDITPRRQILKFRKIKKSELREIKRNQSRQHLAKTFENVSKSNSNFFMRVNHLAVLDIHFTRLSNCSDCLRPWDTLYTDLTFDNPFTALNKTNLVWILPVGECL